VLLRLTLNSTENSRFPLPLILSDEVLRCTGMSERELLLEIALFLFERERLTLGRASRLAGLSRVELQRVLGSRGIAIPYDARDFQADPSALRDSGLL
jgi:predicted HTH domain antitoxin